MVLIEEAYKRLFPSKYFPYEEELEYNRRLSSFNANITIIQNKIKVKLNLQWKDIDDEIKIGLIQHLLCKVLKRKITTTNIELYHNFVRNIPMLMPKDNIDSHLKESFDRVNEQFFNGDMEVPNLQWGTDSKRKLACYNFHNDTVTVSTIFRYSPSHVVDLLMYHELLHKHFQFTHKNGRSTYHSTEFKAAEKLYPNYNDVEIEIRDIITGKKPFSLFGIKINAR
jgi:hypothetical protein